MGFCRGVMTQIPFLYTSHLLHFTSKIICLRSVYPHGLFCFFLKHFKACILQKLQMCAFSADSCAYNTVMI